MTSRALTHAERTLVASVFGEAIDYEPVRINRRKYWPFQTRNIVMAPDGQLWFHPEGGLCHDDFGCASLLAQGLFIHEMTHVWQRQKGIWLPVARHPFCRYSYSLKPGWQLERYGLEQQAEIVRHAFLLRAGVNIPGAPALAAYESLLPFARA
jgi:hypothetical protein